MIAPEAVAEREAAAFAANTFRRIFLVMAALLIVGTPLLWVRYGGGVALSFVIGGAISLLNFYWLNRILAALVDAVALRGKKRSAGGIVLRFVLRYLLIALAAYAIFKSSDMSMVGLCAGLSLPVGAVLIEAAYAIYGALRRGF
ncbi:MAG TPA: ATP synthase subunit I [Candidatus Angelobacter sp.]|nr:ATP synthase subunit I [Candidatus Angelobacter sp.]